MTHRTASSSIEDAPRRDSPTGFSTHGLATRDQFDAWREHVGSRFGIADFSRSGSAPFRARMQAISIGELSLCAIAADAHTFDRSRHQVAGGERDQFTIGLLDSGTGILEQDGRIARLGPGDLVLCDNRRPYRIRFDEPFRQRIFLCDRAQLEALLPDAARRTALRVHGRAALASATAAYVVAIGQQADGFGAAESAVARHAVDLLSLAFADVLAPSPASWLLMARVRAYIEDNLAHPDLTPAMIARRHRISRRQLFRLFNENGGTVAAFIRGRRLARCKASLADERQAERSVSEIALAYGFNDASTFGRAFRKAFGATPRDYRRAALPRLRGNDIDG
jgi:AraC-like DNA-binding protein